MPKKSEDKPAATLAADLPLDPPNPPSDDPPSTGSKPLPTVSEHCRAQFPEQGPRGRRRQHPEMWRHAAAAALHMWKLHAHHEACEKRLSAEDYAKALEAGATLDRKGVPHPHQPALYAVKGS